MNVSLSLSVQPQSGILSMLDDECMRPGNATDSTFLDKLNDICGKHERFKSHNSLSTKRSINNSQLYRCFCVDHYAGMVRTHTHMHSAHATECMQYAARP